MATSLYDKARERFATAGINWLTDTVKAVLVDTGTYSFSNSHEFLSDIPAGSRVSSSVTLTSKAVVGGACDAADLTWPAVSGLTAEAVVLYKDTGSEATSPLIIFIDTATGLPITPNTGDIIVNWDNGVSRIFKL